MPGVYLSPWLTLLPSIPVMPQSRKKFPSIQILFPHRLTMGLDKSSQMTAYYPSIDDGNTRR